MNSNNLINRSILEGLSLAVAVFDKEMRLELANDAFLNLWSLDKDWVDLHPNLDEVFEKLRTKRLLPEVEDFKLFKQEEIANFTSPVRIKTDMMYLPDGRSLRREIKPNLNGGLVYSFENVTEQLKLHRLVNELGAVQSETLDNLHEGVAVFGSDGKLKLSNPKFSNLWSFEDVFLHMNPHVTEVIELMRELILPEAADQTWDDLSWIAYKNSVISKILNRTPNKGRMQLVSGLVIDFSNTPLPDGATLLSYLDVTDSVKIQQALMERAKALEDANHIKSEFIANVSREIKAPLDIISGHAEMLEQGYFGELNSRQEEYVCGINVTSKGLVNIVNDILDLAKMDAGQMELIMVPIDIHELLSSALVLIKNRVKQKQLKVEFDCAIDIGWIIGDKERLKQVFYKLLSNAITFTHSRGKITLGAKRARGVVRISLADTGIGIPNHEKAHVFEPFFQSSAKRGESKNELEEEFPEEYGTGLGLTIVKQFVERHSGTIELKSLVGRGTKIVCQFPEMDPSYL